MNRLRDFRVEAKVVMYFCFFFFREFSPLATRWTSHKSDRKERGPLCSWAICTVQVVSLRPEFTSVLEAGRAAGWALFTVSRIFLVVYAAADGLCSLQIENQVAATAQMRLVLLRAAVLKES